jgi:UDP-N-acetyl-2-amino-2-deoxyglucuronate dehydrogenase
MVDTARGLGFALLGAGAGAEAHADALARLPEARLVAVADPDLARARALAGRVGAAALDDPEAALACPGVEAACLAVPNHLHAGLARAAAHRGLAVLVEKPLGRDLAEARAIVAACAEQRVPLGLVLQNRFAPEVRALRAELAAGRLGTLVGAAVLVRCERDARYFAAGPWRARRETAGGGVLLIQAIHMLDLLDWLAGPVAAGAAAAATRAHPVDVEDVLVATLELPGGAPASLLATTAARPECPARVELYGTAGSAVVLEARGVVRVWHGAAGLPALAAVEAEMAARLAAPWPAGGAVELHRALLADFVASVRAGRPPAVDGSAALRLQALVESIYAAARLGTPRRPGI